MSTEEKKLDDIQEIYTALNKAPNVDIQKAINNVIKYDEYQNTNFKACLEKFICEYASTNGLTIRLKEEIEGLSQFPDKEIYDLIVDSFREYITIVRNRYDKKDDNKSEKECDAYMAFKIICQDKKFIDIGRVVGRFFPYHDCVIMPSNDFWKFSQFVKYTQIPYTKQKNYFIAFPGITFQEQNTL